MVGEGEVDKSEIFVYDLEKVRELTREVLTGEIYSLKKVVSRGMRALKEGKTPQVNLAKTCGHLLRLEATELAIAQDRPEGYLAATEVLTDVIRREEAKVQRLRSKRTASGVNPEEAHLRSLTALSENLKNLAFDRAKEPIPPAPGARNSAL